MPRTPPISLVHTVLVIACSFLLSPASHAAELSYRHVAGASDFADYAGVDLDRDGNAYLVGSRNNGGSFEVWVVKLDGVGGGVLWQQNLSGNDDDLGLSIALDEDGSVFVVGRCSSWASPAGGQVRRRSRSPSPGLSRSGSAHSAHWARSQAHGSGTGRSRSLQCTTPFRFSFKDGWDGTITQVDPPRRIQFTPDESGEAAVTSEALCPRSEPSASRGGRGAAAPLRWSARPGEPATPNEEECHAL